MNIDSYLSLKYQSDRPTTITRAEAKILGIKFPLKKGWRLQHGHREITVEMAARLSDAMSIRSGRMTTTKAKALALRGSKASLVAAKHAQWSPKPISVTSDAFLQSYEWRRVRMQAIKQYGARCQCCGATPADSVRLHVDHIKPRQLFPALALDIENLQILCEECNHGKGNWDMTDWREAMLRDKEPAK